MIRRPPRSTLFPYPTLSRSHAGRLELLPDLALHEIDTLVDRLRRLGAGLDVREAGEVIQCVHEPLHQVRLRLDRKSTRLNSSHSQISYAVFCLKKKNRHPTD